MKYYLTWSSLYFWALSYSLCNCNWNYFFGALCSPFMTFPPKYAAHPTPWTHSADLVLDIGYNKSVQIFRKYDLQKILIAVNYKFYQWGNPIYGYRVWNEWWKRTVKKKQKKHSIINLVNMYKLLFFGSQVMC